MNWIDFDKQLPEEGQIILAIYRNKAWRCTDDKLVYNKLCDNPIVTRFRKQEYEEEGSQSETSSIINDEYIDMYSFSVCWIPIPKVPEQFSKDDFVDKEYE